MFEKESGYKMREKENYKLIKDMNESEYIDYMHQLLVKSEFRVAEIEREYYQDSMYKRLFGSDGNKQKSIRSMLEENGVTLKSDETLDTFLFYFTYITY